MITLYVFSALVVGIYIVSGVIGVFDTNLQFFAFQIVPITLSMTVGFCLAKRDIKFVEIQGHLLIVTQLLVIALSNYSGLFEMDRF